MGSAKSQKLSNTLLSQTEGYLKSHQVCWFLAEHSSSKEQPWPESRQSNFPGDSQMKYFLLASLLSIAVLLVACGAGHPRLTSIAVSPSSATAASSPQRICSARAKLDGAMPDGVARSAPITGHHSV